MPEISVKWPFYRYEVLMPEHISTDIFVWLYLSLFVHINQQMGKSKNSYSTEEKNQVKRLIKEEFSNVIDEITLDKIITYAEKNYVVRDETVVQHEMRKIIDENAFQLLESFDGLFSSNLQIKHFYQDGITGEVVPVFEDMPYLRDCTGNEYKRLNLMIFNKPSPGRIKAAYKNYIKMLNNSSSEAEIINEPAFDDPDAEVDFKPFIEDDGLIDATENSSPKDIENFNVLFLEKTLMNFKVDLKNENGEIQVITPFDTQKTSKWMNKRFQEARTTCPELIETLKIIQPPDVSMRRDKSVENGIIYKKDVAYQLDVCGKIYRLVESINNSNPDIQKVINDLIIMLIKIDKYFTGKSDSFFQQIGLFLECLILPLIDYSDKDIRQRTTEDFFKTQIRTICSKMHLKWDFLMRGKDIFREWQMSRNHYKADTLNIVISSPKFLKCASIYYEFIEDAFNLYNLRNKYGHYKNGNSLDEDFKLEYINVLYKVTKVFLDLY